MNRGVQTAKSVVLFAVLAASAGSARADWSLSAESGALYDSNLTNANRAADVAEDWAWKSEVAIGKGFQLARDLRLNIAADLRGEVWDQFHDFDRLGGGASAALRYRFGLGRQAPWVLLENRLGYDRYHDTPRSNWDESLRLRGGISLSPRVALEAGYTFENLAAGEKLWDQQSQSGSAHVIANITSSLQVALGYTYRNGDVVSYAIPPRPDLIQVATVIESVSTFGTNPRYTAYRLRAETQSISFLAGYGLTRHLSLQAGYIYATSSHADLTYENHLVEAKIAFAY